MKIFVSINLNKFLLSLLRTAQSGPSSSSTSLSEFSLRALRALSVLGARLPYGNLLNYTPNTSAPPPLYTFFKSRISEPYTHSTTVITKCSRWTASARIRMRNILAIFFRSFVLNLSHTEQSTAPRITRTRTRIMMIRECF